MKHFRVLPNNIFSRFENRVLLLGLAVVITVEVDSVKWRALFRFFGLFLAFNGPNNSELNFPLLQMVLFRLAAVKGLLIHSHHTFSGLL